MVENLGAEGPTEQTVCKPAVSCKKELRIVLVLLILLARADVWKVGEPLWLVVHLPFGSHEAKLSTAGFQMLLLLVV